MPLNDIPEAIDEIARAITDGDPVQALAIANRWAKTIGTDRAYLLAMAQWQARDGREKAQEFIANEVAKDILEICKLMNKWGWRQIECRDGVAVVTKPCTDDQGETRDE